MEPKDSRDDRKDFAKQLVTYADAIAAFSLVQAIALGFDKNPGTCPRIIPEFPPEFSECFTPAPTFTGLGLRGGTDYSPASSK
jgi:hypothetical protein